MLGMLPQWEVPHSTADQRLVSVDPTTVVTQMQEEDTHMGGCDRLLGLEVSCSNRNQLLLGVCSRSLKGICLLRRGTKPRETQCSSFPPVILSVKMHHTSHGSLFVSNVA